MMRRVFLLCCVLAQGAPLYADSAPIAPDDVKAIVEILASDEMAGRRSGEDGVVTARHWLKNWLTREGFVPAGSRVDSFEQPFKEGVNLLALSHADGPMDPKIILSAHYDHNGKGCRSHPQATSTICNGAVDNATGVALALLTAKRLKAMSDVPFAIALWDAEERGLKGSRYFTKEPTFPVASLRLMLNFDIIGLNLFRGFENNHFIIGAETGGAPLLNDVRAAMEGAATTFHEVSYAFGHMRSDVSSFFFAGYKLPFVFFSDGDGSVYHTTADEPQHVNYGKAADVGEVATRLAMRTLGRERGYTYVKPKLAVAVVLPTYSDVAAILTGVESAIQYADDNELSIADREALLKSARKLRKMKDGGAKKFGMLDSVALGKIAGELLGLSARLPFIP